MSKIVLFTGGAPSGKSRRAEQRAAQLSEHVVYIATAEVHDDEMRDRIDAHQRRRPATWRTIEAPHSAAAALGELEAGSVVLLDCLSLLVSNLLLAHEANPLPTVEAEVDRLLAVVHERNISLIVVTSEVGMGIVPAYPLGRVYRDLLGWANQRVATAAGEVYLCVCGIPLELKALEAAWARE